MFNSRSRVDEDASHSRLRRECFVFSEVLDFFDEGRGSLPSRSMLASPTLRIEVVFDAGLLLAGYVATQKASLGACLW